MLHVGAAALPWDQSLKGNTMRYSGLYLQLLLDVTKVPATVLGNPLPLGKGQDTRIHCQPQHPYLLLNSPHPLSLVKSRYTLQGLGRTTCARTAVILHGIIQHGAGNTPQRIIPY